MVFLKSQCWFPDTGEIQFELWLAPMAWFTKEKNQITNTKEEEKTVAADRHELKQMKKQAQQKMKEEMERNFIIEALRKGEGNIQRSAAMVNMDRRQFQNLIKKYGIAKEEFGKNWCEK